MVNEKVKGKIVLEKFKLRFPIHATNDNKNKNEMRKIKICSTIKNQALKRLDTFQTTQKQQHQPQSTLGKSILNAKIVIKNISAMHERQA